VNEVICTSSTFSFLWGDLFITVTMTITAIRMANITTPMIISPICVSSGKEDVTTGAAVVVVDVVIMLVLVVTLLLVVVLVDVLVEVVAVVGEAGEIVKS